MDDLAALSGRAAEDIGAGDVTTRATVPSDAHATALITQKRAGVIYGLRAAELAFTLLDGQVEVLERAPEGVWRARRRLCRCRGAPGRC